MKAFSYINLDGVVQGIYFYAIKYLTASCAYNMTVHVIFRMTECKSSFPGPKGFKVAASPLMHSLIQSTMNEVNPQLEAHLIQACSIVIREIISSIYLWMFSLYNIRISLGELPKQSWDSLFSICEGQLGDICVSLTRLFGPITSIVCLISVYTSPWHPSCSQ